MDLKNLLDVIETEAAIEARQAEGLKDAEYWRRKYLRACLDNEMLTQENMHLKMRAIPASHYNGIKTPDPRTAGNGLFNYPYGLS